MNLAYRQLRYVTKGGTIPNPGAGDNQAVNFRCNLPQNFAYVLLQFGASVVGTGAASWVTTGMLEVQNGGSSSDYDFKVMCEVLTGTNTNANDHTSWKAQQLYQGLIICDQGEDGQIKFKTENGVANDDEHTFQGQVIVNQYTIAQANHFLLSTPMYMRG